MIPPDCPITLAPSFLESPVWNMRRPMWTLLAIYLLLKVSRRAESIVWDGRPMRVSRGQLVTSTGRLAYDLIVDRQVVRSALANLADEDFLTYEASKEITSGFTLITILDIDTYLCEQDIDNQQGTEEENQELTNPLTMELTSTVPSFPSSPLSPPHTPPLNPPFSLSPSEATVLTDLYENETQLVSSSNSETNFQLVPDEPQPPEIDFDYDEYFETWWRDFCWRKDAKEKARAAFKKCINGITKKFKCHPVDAFEKLAEWTEEYLTRFQETPGWKVWRGAMLPATFLNGKRWQDQIA